MQLSAITGTQEKKKNFLENVAFLKKMMLCLLWQSSSSVDIFIRNNFSAKKLAVPKSKWPKELLIFEKWLLGRSFAQKN